MVQSCCFVCVSRLFCHLGDCCQRSTIGWVCRLNVHVHVCCIDHSLLNLCRYNHSGVTALRFEADYSGMIHFTTAECVVEVEVVEDKVIEVPDNSTTAANSTDKANDTSSKGDDKAGDDKSKDGDNKAASGDSAADKEEKEHKSETEAAEDEKKGEAKEGDKDRADDEGEELYWGGERGVSVVGLVGGCSTTGAKDKLTARLAIAIKPGTPVLPNHMPPSLIPFVSACTALPAPPCLPACTSFRHRRQG